MAPPPRQTPASAPACSMPVDPQATACTSPDHRGRTLRALQRGFGVQYWGETYTATALADAPHGLLIIEATRTGADQAPDNKELLFSRQDIARISHNGARPVLAYVNLAEIEAYRDYWTLVRHQDSDPKQEVARSWVGPRTERSEQLARYYRVCSAPNLMRQQRRNNRCLTKADSKKKRPQRVADTCSIHFSERSLQCLT